MHSLQQFKNGAKVILEQCSNSNKETKNIVPKLFKEPSERLIELMKTLTDGNEEIENLVLKLDDLRMKCSVFGYVSAGKSAVINCLLGKKLLPSGNYSVTNTLLQVQKCKNGIKEHLEFDEKKKKISKIKKVNKKLKNTKTCTKEMKIYFKPKSDQNSFPENLIIYDTPGIDFDENMDGIVKRKCDDSDIIVLVLNVRSSLGIKEKENITKMKTQFTNFNVFIIFNFWDLVCENVEDASNTRKENTKLAVDFLVNKLNIPCESAMNRIHFISAKKTLECIKKKINNKMWMDPFTEMKNEMMKEMSRSSTEKQNIIKTQIMDTLKSMLAAISEQIELLRTKHNEISNLIDKLKSKTSDEIKAEIKKKIEKEFKNSINSFGEKSLDLVRLTDINVNEKIPDVLISVFGELIKNVETILMDTIKKDILRGNDNDDIMKLLFKNFHNVISSQVSKEKCKEIIDTCNDLKQKYSTVLIGGTIIGSVLMVILAPKILPLFGYKALTNMGGIVSLVCSTAKGTFDKICGYIDSNRSKSENEIMSQLNNSFNDISFDALLDNLKLGESDITKLETLFSDIQKEMKNLETHL